MRSIVGGIGAVSAAGRNVLENVSSLEERKSFEGRPRHFSTAIDVPVDEVADSNEALSSILCDGLDRCENETPADAISRISGFKCVSRTAMLGMVAASESVRNFLGNGFHFGKKVVLISGSSVGGMDISEQFWTACRQNPAGGDVQMLAMHSPGESTKAIARYLQAAFPDLKINEYSTISTACSSAGNAIMLAARMLQAGQADTVIAGGTDALCRFTLNGFNSLHILDTERCRPFDAGRAGLNLGEGAGYLVLTRDGNGDAWCSLSGWAGVAEAYHQTGSSPDGSGPFMAMSSALECAGLDASEIGFVNTHGTGTPSNDLSESMAMKRLFGDSVPAFSSLKSLLGHTLGASEGIEAAFCAYSLKHGTPMVSMNFHNPIPETGLSPLTDAAAYVRPRHMLSNSFGFGGNGCSLVFSSID